MNIQAGVTSRHRRLFGVRCKGVVVIPNTTRWTGPWLGATRRLSLQRVANRPIVCHVLDTMLEAGIVDIAVLLPHDAIGEISACISAEGPPGISVRYLEHYPEESPDQALTAVAEFAAGDLCVLHRANGMLGEPLAQFAESLRADSLDALLLVQDDGREAPRLRLVGQRQRPLDPIAEGSPALPAAAGVCVLGPGALRRLGTGTAQTGAGGRLNAEGMEPGQELDLALMALALAREGARVYTRAVQGWRIFTGDAQDLLAMNRAALDRLDPEATMVATDGNRFEGAVAIHPTASVTSSVIIGPVIIGADALIADSYIGPHTSIGERVRIEGAELERSIVLADASLLHVGGRLVASVVGRQARIFRDFSMPRALRLHVGDGDEVALC